MTVLDFARTVRGVILRALSRSILFLLLATAPTFAEGFPAHGPLSYHEQNPLYMQSISLKPERAIVLDLGESVFAIDSFYSNMYESGRSDKLIETIDMEFWRNEFQFDLGIGRQMQVGLVVPFISMYGGFLDAFIQDFHKFFGLPNGWRERVPNGRFRFNIRNGNGDELYKVDRLMLGLGDISAEFKHQVVEEDALVPAVSWFFKWKFPTGSVHSGTGSGSPDFGLGARLEKTIWRWHGYLNMGYFLVGPNGRLENFENWAMFCYSLSNEFSISHPVSAVIQLDGGTPLLTSGGFTEWDGIPMDLIVGVKGDHPNALGGTGFQWQVGFAEDILAVGPSIDFTVLIRLGFFTKLF